MRYYSLYLLFLLLLFYSKGANAQEATVTLNMTDAKVSDILDEIEKQADFYFLLNQDIIDINRLVSITVDDQSVDIVLDELFRETDVYYVIENQQIVLTTYNDSVQANNVITGFVRDQEGNPLAGVLLIIEGTGNGVITDSNGKYTISNVPEGAVLKFSHIGMKSQDISINDSTALNVTLTEDIINLDEIVAIGYGTQLKRDVTGSIQSLLFEELSDIPVSTITQKLQGQLSGVQINQTTGRLGLGMQFRVRGQASLTAGNEPLYVVDGFPIAGDVNNINPSEIENISVLKDASSTALYGSRAANGVILITTKKAQLGKTNIGISAYHGIQQVPLNKRPDMMNGAEFAQFKKESYEDKGLEVPEIFQNPEEYAEGYNHYDAILRNASIQNYSVTLSANKENFSTTSVFGYLNQDGVVLNSNLNRFSVRINSEYNISEKITAALNVAPTHSVNNTPTTDGQFWTGGLMNNALIIWPIFPYKNEDGTLPIMIWDEDLGTFPTPNTYRAAKELTNETKTSRIIANTFLEYKPIAGLNLKTSLNYDYGNTKFVSIQPSTSISTFAILLPTTSRAIFRNSQYNTWLNENILTYKRSTGDHNFDLLAGVTLQKFRSDQLQITVTGFPDDRLATIQSANNIDRTDNNTSNDIQEWSMMSYIGRLNYNYKNKYLVSLAIRTDGSSRFGTDNRWGTFPSASFGWILSDEDFMKKAKPISFLKLRMSYGVVGNNNIGNYTQYATVSSGRSEYNAIFGSSLGSGSAVTQLPNPGLTWEQTVEYDLGLDISFLNNKFNFVYDFYTRRSKSLLYSVRVAQESGFSSFNGNIGELKFWGHEFQVNTKNMNGELKWDTNFNISFTDNKVEALYGGVDRINDGFMQPNITKVGEKIGLFYGMIWDGIYDSQEEFDSSPKATLSEVGTIKFRDVGGGPDGLPDGVITHGGDNDDRTIIGDPTPDFTFGFTNSFTYKNFDLSIVMSGAYGNDVANMSEQGLVNLDGVFNIYKEVKDRWRSPENPGAGKYGKTTSGTAYERDWFHSRFISDASFLTIKNVTFGYSIHDPSFLSNIRKLRFYMSVQQLYVFTKYKGLNPEVSMNAFGQSASALNLGLDYGSYPVPRTISFGFNIDI